MFLEPQQPDDFNEKLREYHEKLDGVTRKIGLHLQQLELSKTPDEGNLPETLKGKMVLQGLFMIGDIAYSAEVQDPEAARIKEEFRDIVPNVSDTFLDIREQMKRDAEHGFFEEDQSRDNDK